MIAVSSSASFGSAGVTMTSEVFSTFIWRRSLSGSASASYLVASLASVTVASMDSWLTRALSAAVSSVMKFCATQPARLARMPNLRCVWFARSRKVPASAGVTAVPGAEAALQATLAASRTPDQQREMRIVMGVFYEDSCGAGGRRSKICRDKRRPVSLPARPDARARVFHSRLPAHVGVADRNPSFEGRAVTADHLPAAQTGAPSRRRQRLRLPRRRTVLSRLRRPSRLGVRRPPALLDSRAGGRTADGWPIGDRDSN